MDAVRGLLHDIKNEVGIFMGFVEEFASLSESLKGKLGSDSFLFEMPLRNKARLAKCLARIEALEASIARENVPHSTLIVKDQVGVIREIAESFGLEVHTEDLGQADHCSFYANTPDLRRVIGNLVENSSKAYATRIFVEASVSPHTVQLIFKDNGHGMDDLQIQELGFGYTSSEGKGHGIGTELVRDIVNSFGGYVHWASIKHLGTCCSITFRRASVPDTCVSKKDDVFLDL